MKFEKLNFQNLNSQSMVLAIFILYVRAITKQCHCVRLQAF